MRYSSFPRLVLLASLGLFAATASVFGLTIPSDGSDGAFAPSSSIEVDLSLATTGDWAMAGDGNGVYDPSQWAVVFKYSSVTIPAGVTVTFKNHPSRAPVIWLVEGAVTIEGTVSLNGQAGHAANALRTFAEPGPGGFRGGRGSDAATSAASGKGPGGSSLGNTASHASSGAGYGAPGETALTNWGGAAPGAAGIVYGNEGVFPLMGGSGAAGSANGAWGNGGGGGGGAILIATPGIFTLNGQIIANGGDGSGAGFSGPGGQNRASGGGSGGGIRLIADTLTGVGTLRALGGARGTGGVTTEGGRGGVGRIRVETLNNSLVDLGNPAFSLGLPESSPRIFRDPVTPTIESVSLAGESLPSDPRARMSFPETDLTLSEAGLKTLLIEASYVPLDSDVTVRVVRRSGADERFAASFTGGTFEASTWSAVVDIAGGFSTVQVHATFPEAE